MYLLDLIGADFHLRISLKTKFVALEAWKSFHIVSYLRVMHNPFSIFEYKSWQFKLIERFIIILYNRVGTHENVNTARWEMFCQKFNPLKKFHLHRCIKSSCYENCVASWNVGKEFQPQSRNTNSRFLKLGDYFWRMSTKEDVSVRSCWTMLWIN